MNTDSATPPSSNPASHPRVLVVGESAEHCAPLIDCLEYSGFNPLAVDDLTPACVILEHGVVDLVLVSAQLPEEGAFELLAMIRADRLSAAASDLPVVFLSAGSTEQARIAAFERGCDDFLVKPISRAELAGRLKAVLRRRRS